MDCLRKFLLISRNFLIKKKRVVQIADPTYWFRRNEEEEIRAVRDPPDLRVVTIAMPTTDPIIVKMVLEIDWMLDWIPLDLQETWYIWSQTAWKTSGSAKKTIDFKICKHYYTRFKSVRKKIWTKLVCCLVVVVLFLSWLVHFW